MALIIEAPKPLTIFTAALHRELSLVFFGTPQFAVPSLRALHDAGWPLAAVVTAPDKPVGRAHTMTPSPVRSCAHSLGIEVHTPETLKDDAFFAAFDALRPDLCIVVAYGKLIPERYLNVPRLGFLNVHPSLLPAYRGPSPIQSAILNGDTVTGVSIMLLDREMDHGPVLATRSWEIPGGFDAATAEDELARLGARLLVETVPQYIEGTAVPVAQDHSRATFCSKFTRADGRIDWTETAERIVNRIRALNRNPGTWTTWHGNILNIFDAHEVRVPLPAAPPGTVHRADDALVISCGMSAIAIDTLQLEGGVRQPAHDFLNGRPSLVGGILGT